MLIALVDRLLYELLPALAEGKEANFVVSGFAL
jgi:hypothetical protein